MASRVARIFGAVLRVKHPCASPAELSAVRPSVDARKGECHIVWRIAPRSRSQSAYMLRDLGRGHLYAPVSESTYFAVNGLGPFLAAA
jgi:hypothetical protein